MSHAFGAIAYEDDLIEAANEHGYGDNWRELLKDKYIELQSTRKAAEVFGRTGPWANTHLKRMGVKLRKRGGKVYTKWQGKKIICPQCEERYVTIMGLCKKCYQVQWFKKYMRSLG